MNSKLHAVVDHNGMPVAMTLTEGQRSDHIGAKILYPVLPSQEEAALYGDRQPTLVGDRGYDSDEFRAALASKGIDVCIPPIPSRKKPLEYDKRLYKKRNQVERFFGRIKDGRRIATRYDRCADIFMAAITIAAIFTTYLNQ